MINPLYTIKQAFILLNVFFLWQLLNSQLQQTQSNKHLFVCQTNSFADCISDFWLFLCTPTNRHCKHQDTVEDCSEEWTSVISPYTDSVPALIYCIKKTGDEWKYTVAFCLHKDLTYPPVHFLLHLFFKESASLCIFGQCISFKPKNTALFNWCHSYCVSLFVTDNQWYSWFEFFHVKLLTDHLKPHHMCCVPPVPTCVTEIPKSLACLCWEETAPSFFYQTPWPPCMCLLSRVTRVLCGRPIAETPGPPTVMLPTTGFPSVWHHKHICAHEASVVCCSVCKRRTWSNGPEGVLSPQMWSCCLS